MRLPNHVPVTNRVGTIGGSDVAPIVLGKPVYKTTDYDVWSQVMGTRESSPISWQMARGTVLEPYILGTLAHSHGWYIDPGDGITFGHPDHDWMLFHADGLGGARLYEVKTVGWNARVFECQGCDASFSKGVADALRAKQCPHCESDQYRVSKLWGENGSDHIPDYVHAQVQYGMTLTERDHARVVTLIGDSSIQALFLAACGHWTLERVLESGALDMRVYEIESDPDFAAHIIETLVDWWDRHVLTNTPPTLDPEVLT